MKTILVDCDDAPVPLDLAALKSLERKSLRHRGARANMTLRVFSPSSTLLSRVENRAADLLRIASYVYATDQSVSRGGEVDLHGDDWKRDITLLIPVSDPGFWNQEALCEPLCEVLNFASGDYWKFRFTRASPEDTQLPFEMDSSTTLGKPDSVYLFSGGLDSLCAVVEAAKVMGKRPLLVGHSPAFNVKGRQHALAQALRERFKGGWQYPYISAPIHRVGSDASDYSQRTRGFLFSALGVVIADRLGLKEVCLADNGVVSLNLPINDQLLLARATRSTHPKFIRLFNEFSSLVLSNAPKVLNPLWARTRTEAIDILKKTDAAELIEETNSCSHGRYLTNMQPHCGVCFQCIDRRFATLAAGLEEHDPPERYKVDIFKQAIDQGNDRTMVLSYVRFATEIGRLDELGLFHRFPDLYECVNPSDLDNRHVAESLVGLLRRHAAGITRVMEEQISLAKTEIVQETLPLTCLIRLLAGSGEGKDDFRHSPDYRQVWMRDEEFDLTTNQARVVELLHQQHLDGTKALSQGFILETLEIKSQNLAQVFRGSKAWAKLVVSATGRGMYQLNI